MTLDRIKQQGGGRSKLGMETLMWISHSGRPLQSEELCNALGVKPGVEDFNIHNVPPIRTVLSCALGLVVLDENASTVRLVHFTLQEYLVQHPTLFVTAHSMMAEVCLTFLNSRRVRALIPSLLRALKITKFLEYATCFWGTHAVRGLTEPVKFLAMKLLDGYENHISAAILCRKRELDRLGWPGSAQGINGLHCISFWGIAEIAIAMLEIKRWEVNGCDSSGGTPLMWAVECRNIRMVELFPVFATEEGGDLQSGSLEGFYFVCEGEAGVSGAELREGAALVWVEEDFGPGDGRQSDGHHPLEDFGDGFQEDDAMEGGGALVGSFAGLIQDYTVGSF